MARLLDHFRATAFAMLKLAIPCGLLAGCPSYITVDQPAKGVVVDTTFDVAIYWWTKVTDVHVFADGVDVTSAFTFEPGVARVQGKLTLSPGQHVIRATGKLDTGQAVSDEHAFQTGGFSVSVGAANVDVVQGGSATLQITVSRASDAQGPVSLVANGLPAGVTMTPTSIGAGAPGTSVTFSAAPDAPVTTANVSIDATTTTGTGSSTQHASVAVHVTAKATTAPTWSMLYDKYFAGTSGTPGHCMKCHGGGVAKTKFDPGNDKNSFYAEMVNRGLVNPSAGPSSSIGSASSPLFWISSSGNMPQDGLVANDAAKADITAWVQAGAKND